MCCHLVKRLRVEGWPAVDLAWNDTGENYERETAYTDLQGGVQWDGAVLHGGSYGGRVHAGEERRVLSERRHHGRRLGGEERLDRLHGLKGLAGLHQLEGGVGQQRRGDACMNST